MDEDFRERFNNLEEAVADLRVQVRGLDGKVDALDVKVDALDRRVSDLIPHLATKADLSNLEIKLNEKASSLIGWMVTTTIASVGVASGVAFAIARFTS